ncbi:MAG: NADH-quinone oxidoreductase subunit N [Bacteroidia bacterium]
MNVLLTISGLGILSMLAEMLKFKKQLFILVLAGLIGALILSFIDWNTGFSYYHDMMLVDNYAIAFSGLLIVIAFLWFLMSRSYFTSETSAADHYALILFSLAGGIVMVSFADLTMFFIGLEILSVSLYVLAGSDKLNIKSNESALKYFMMGAFATGFLLFGIALIYGVCGTFNLREIAIYAGQNSENLPVIFYAGIILMLVGLLFKVSAVPFHFWAPDVYDGAPTVVTAYMATIVKTAAFAAFYRLFSTCFSSVADWWTPLIAIISAITMLLGNILAVYQTSLKRMLAYSSIAHAGYILMAVASLNQTSSGAILLYATAYSLASIGIFTVLHVVSSSTGDESISGLKGFSKSHPFASVLISILILSMAGIPPVAGFFAKYYIFYAALKSDLTWLVLIAVLSSLIGVYYYFRVIIAMYQPDGKENKNFSFEGINFLVLLLTGILSLAIGIAPGFLIGLL